MRKTSEKRIGRGLLNYVRISLNNSKQCDFCIINANTKLKNI